MFFFVTPRNKEPAQDPSATIPISIHPASVPLPSRFRPASRPLPFSFSPASSSCLPYLLFLVFPSPLSIETLVVQNLSLLLKVSLVEILLLIPLAFFLSVVFHFIASLPLLIV